MISTLEGVVGAAVGCTSIWQFLINQNKEKAKVKAERDIEIEKTKSESLQKTLDRELEARKELNAAWEKVDAERAAVYARFDAFQQSLINSREQAILEQQKMYEVIIQLRTDLGNAQQQLGEAQGHIKASEMETAQYKRYYEQEKAKYEKEVIVNLDLQSRVRTLEEKDKSKE